MLGLTSVTFRQLGAGEIVERAASCGLEGMEWGGDIHVPHGDLPCAREVRRYTEAAGLAVLSYGSYHRLCAGGEFSPVLASAVELGAPLIRVWAGGISSAGAGEEYRSRAASELRDIAREAERQGIGIGLEYHRDTLTDCWESARALLEAADAPNLTTYWQPNPELTPEDHANEIRRLYPWLSNVHVFHWLEDGERRRMEEGMEVWREYATLLGKGLRPFHAILEFVPEDDPGLLPGEAAVLRELFG